MGKRIKINKRCKRPGGKCLVWSPGRQPPNVRYSFARHRVLGKVGLSPPVRDKLLTWHPGKTETAFTYIQSTNTLGEPEYNAFGEPEMEISGTGIFRKDYAKALGDFPLLATHSHCCTFDGVGDYILLDDQSTYLVNYVSFSITTTDTDIQILGLLTTVSGTVWNINLNSGRINIVTGSGGSGFRTITAFNDGAAHTVEVNATDGTIIVDGLVQSLMASSGYGDGTHNIIGARSGTSRFLSGALWAFQLDDILYSFSEGAGTTVHSSDGLHTGDITTTDIGAFWGSYQDEYHCNLTHGWWEIDGDPVKYPYNPIL